VNRTPEMLAMHAVARRCALRRRQGIDSVALFSCERRARKLQMTLHRACRILLLTGGLS